MTRLTLFTACVTLFVAGCAGAPQKIATPPVIIQVPQYMPLPIECAQIQDVNLPAGSTAADVMEQLKLAVDAYNDQVDRCFNMGAGDGN
jgi:hypothetical protein